MILHRVIIMWLVAGACGCAWGFLVDNVLTFGKLSLTIECLGAVYIGIFIPKRTYPWWKRRLR